MRIDQLRSWPTKCEYALDKRELGNAGWEHPKLAVNMQKVWGVPILQKSTGLNVIFFRAPNLEEWRRLETGLRIELEKFSEARARRIIEALQPKHLVVIGLEISRRLAPSATSVMVRSGGNGRPLVVQGEIWGVTAFGIIHLSGARLSGDDLKAIRAYFGERISN
jgi:hypothetical protein